MPASGDMNSYRYLPEVGTVIVSELPSPPETLPATISGRVGEAVPPSDTVEVTIKIEKLNPYKLIWTGNKTLTAVGDEITFLRFTVDNKGEVISSNELEYPLVLEKGKNTAQPGFTQ